MTRTSWHGLCVIPSERIVSLETGFYPSLCFFPSLLLHLLLAVSKLETFQLSFGDKLPKEKHKYSCQSSPAFLPWVWPDKNKISYSSCLAETSGASVLAAPERLSHSLQPWNVLSDILPCNLCQVSTHPPQSVQSGRWCVSRAF